MPCAPANPDQFARRFRKTPRDCGVTLEPIPSDEGLAPDASVARHELSPNGALNELAGLQTCDMDLKHWPEDFLAKKRGEGCPQCVDGSVPETEHGVRFFNTDIADGYLQRVGPTPGYSVVVFRGRHVGDPQSMTSDEHASFWTAVGKAAKAIESVYDPIHLNFQILGNRDPHVHVHIVPRFDPDPAPSMPLPEAAWIHSTALSESELGEQVHALRIAVESD